ncbi:LOW QUALITY PROTEIN: interstitial collagenase-like [Anopheles nili]|uniref:LOW QUALITY PROTEIN: interstitial collagenase-like n=1 Tax=Anopheles nili TaxID=185578 RepID=UPI00237AD924|nr:LOW QUALITY PROTEIN: interstitial collagenase-like [Anopheles nili]
MVRSVRDHNGDFVYFGVGRFKDKNASVSQHTDNDFQEAIMEYQSLNYLKSTGVLDAATTEMMRRPRCGLKDKHNTVQNKSVESFVLHKSRWEKKHLTYGITKYSKWLHWSVVDREIAKAFSLWSEHIDLTFTQHRNEPVDIDIRFEKYIHHDENPFDGPGQVLAHAFIPKHGGDIHFDDTEHWTVNSTNGTNLLQVATHEVGHSLGLLDTRDQSDAMYFAYLGYDPNFQLSRDDIFGIQRLYGKKNRYRSWHDGENNIGMASNTITSRPSVAQESELCTSKNIDAIFQTDDDSTIVFLRNKYYKLLQNEVAPGYPKDISDGWPGLPGNIDAAFTYENGKTYFFQGNKYWRYRGRQIDGDYPREISDGFPGIPNNLNAAMLWWNSNSTVYFFKDRKFWLYDPNTTPPVKPSYPKPISNIEGLPDQIDAALHHPNGNMYFFRGDKYYRVDGKSSTVDHSGQPYPRRTASWWFGCKNLTRDSTHLTNYEHF